ncbi:MAG: hypothetical protein AAGM67_21370 [Bacteroidota bacterium]
MATSYHLQRRSLRKDDASCNYLTEKFGRNEKSQGGEDGVLEKIFGLGLHCNEGILQDKESRSQYWCVEFGAWDGIYLSNAWNLIKKHGWVQTN